MQRTRALVTYAKISIHLEITVDFSFFCRRCCAYSEIAIHNRISIGRSIALCCRIAIHNHIAIDLCFSLRSRRANTKIAVYNEVTVCGEEGPRDRK